MDVPFHSFSQIAAPSDLVGRPIGLGLSRFGPSSKLGGGQVVLSTELVVQEFCGYCADDSLAAVYLLQEVGEKKPICKQYAHLAKPFSNECRLKVYVSPLSRCQCIPLSWLQSFIIYTCFPKCRDAFIAAAGKTEESHSLSLTPIERKDGHCMFTRHFCGDVTVIMLLWPHSP